MFSNSLVWLSFACCRGEYVSGALLPFDFNCCVSETCYCSALTKYAIGRYDIYVMSVLTAFLKGFTRILSFVRFFPSSSYYLRFIVGDLYWNQDRRFCVAIPVLSWQRFMMEFWNSCFTLAMTYDGIWNVPLSLATCDSCRISYLLGGLFVILQLKIFVFRY